MSNQAIVMAKAAIAEMNAKGLSQGEIARMLGDSQGNISRFLRGQGERVQTSLQKYARVCDAISSVPWKGGAMAGRVTLSCDTYLAIIDANIKKITIYDNGMAVKEVEFNPILPLSAVVMQIEKEIESINQ